MERLTDEILLLIFSDLATLDLFTVRQVNKRFRSVCNDGYLYRKMCFKKSLNVSTKLFHQLCIQHSNQIKSIIFTDCFWIPSNQMVNALQHCINIEELVLTGSRLSMKGLCRIFANNNRIKRLGWSIPSPIPEFHKRGQLFGDIQKIFKKLDGILLRFDSLNSFESFLPVFDTVDIVVNEFGLEYLSDRTSSYFAMGNIYRMYVKCREKFQICLKDAIDVNRFLHFNLLVTDFVMQTVSKAAKKHNIITLLAPGNTNSLCWKYISSVLDILSYERIHLSSSTLCKDQIKWLSKLTLLTHLNLSNVMAFKSNLMRAIAMNCPRLVSLNLSHCNDWIDKELHGLESVATHCLHLTELNLSSVHIHSDSELNKLSKIISQMTSLKHLSLPSCGLVNNVAAIDNTKDNMNNSPAILSRQTIGFKPTVTSSLALSFDNSSSSSDSTDFANYMTRKVRLSQVEDSLTEQTGSGLDLICSSCLKIEELEIMNTGFNSAFNRSSTSDHKNFCPLSAQLRDKVFGRIGQLKYLRKLTFAGLSGISTFSSLNQIASCCELLEDLSIAYCGLSGHAGNLSVLQQAIVSCKNLKRFRFDQPHFVIRETFLESFYHCKRLQVLCLINKNGKAPKNPDEYMKLFHECPCLVAFFLFNGTTIAEATNLQKKISKTFKCRPSLCVSILPYFNALTEEGLKNVPYIYLRDVIRFESRVAVCTSDGS